MATKNSNLTHIGLKDSPFIVTDLNRTDGPLTETSGTFYPSAREIEFRAQRAAERRRLLTQFDKDTEEIVARQNFASPNVLPAPGVGLSVENETSVYIRVNQNSALDWIRHLDPEEPDVTKIPLAIGLGFGSSTERRYFDISLARDDRLKYYVSAAWSTVENTWTNHKIIVPYYNQRMRLCIQYLAPDENGEIKINKHFHPLKVINYGDRLRCYIPEDV